MSQDKTQPGKVRLGVAGWGKVRQWLGPARQDEGKGMAIIVIPFVLPALSPQTGAG